MLRDKQTASHHEPSRCFCPPLPPPVLGHPVALKGKHVPAPTPVDPLQTINQPDDPPPRVTLTALSHSALHKTTSTWWHASDLARIALSAGPLMSHDTNGAPGIPLPRLLSPLLSPLSEALLGSSRQSAGCAPSAQHYPASAATVRTRAAIPLRTLPPGSAGWSGTTPG